MPLMHATVSCKSIVTFHCFLRSKTIRPFTKYDVKPLDQQKHTTYYNTIDTVEWLYYQRQDLAQLGSVVKTLVKNAISRNDSSHELYGLTGAEGSICFR